MSNIIKSDYELDQYCDWMARDILKEIAEYGGDISDLCHEAADSCEHVIYHYKAHAICQNCNIDDGEEFVSDCGEPADGWSYNGFAVALAYGEIRARLMTKCEELKEEIEENEIENA